MFSRYNILADNDLAEAAEKLERRRSKPTDVGQDGHKGRIGHKLVRSSN
jgi:hypothetical protein